MRILSALIIYLLCGYSWAGTSIVIDLSDAPLLLTSYDSQHQSGNANNRGGSIRHETNVTNNGGQDVLAFSVGFFSFNSFNEYLGHHVDYRMLAIEGGTSWSGRWTQQHPDASTFQEYGTGIAYIRKARLADGTVWEADLDVVLEELQRIFPSFLAVELN